MLCILSSVLALWPANQAGGYRLYGANTTTGAADVADEATRWDPSVWGPGDTLRWKVADIPEWAEYYGSNEEFLDFVRMALAPWSGITTADIAWEVNGFGTGDEAVVTMADTGSRGIAGHATLTIERGQITKCLVTIGPPLYERIDNPDGTYWFRGTPPGDRPKHAQAILLHEFGHCLGLGHSFQLPGPLAAQIVAGNTGRYQNWDLQPSNSVMWSAPYDTPLVLARDDVAGASLLRPVEDWKQGTGSITGQVFVDGKPQSHARIWAFGSGDGGQPGRPDAVAVLSDENGVFHIEGLQPGAYPLWVGPVNYFTCFPDILELVAGTSRELAETWFPVPILVRAGETTRGVDLHARRGRECQPSSPWCASAPR